MSKLEELKELREKLNININGDIEILKSNIPSIFVANHNCLMDIFYLPIAIPYDIVSLISARLLYKNDEERKEMVNKYLYGLPIEAHGGKMYSDICLSSATNLLSNGISLGIFPEGAYIKDKVISRGRTGAIRILFESRKKQKEINLVPVAINIKNEIKDLDFYGINDNIIEMTFLEPISYEKQMKLFFEKEDKNYKNILLHEVMDNAMTSIAKKLNREYIDQYIELFPKGNVIFSDGNKIPVNDASTPYYINMYQRVLDNRTKKLNKILIKK